MKHMIVSSVLALLGVSAIVPFLTSCGSNDESSSSLMRNSNPGGSGGAGGSGTGGTGGNPTGGDPVPPRNGHG